MASKENELSTVYRSIIRIELQTDKLAISAALTDELSVVAAKYGAKVAEVSSFPMTTSPGSRI